MWPPSIDRSGQVRGQQTHRLSWHTIVSPASKAVRYERDHIEAKNPANPNLSTLVNWTGEYEAKPFSEVCLHRLGNLVLDTVSAGSSKGSADFASKVPHYTSRSALLSQGEIVYRFASKDEKGNPAWDVDAIRRRQRALVEFAIKEL